jgi:hypothetical protein
MKTFSQLIAETDSRMYGDDSVLKPKPPCKGKDCDKKKKKPKPFMGYEQVEAMKADPLSEGTSEKKEAMQSIADWKEKMKMVEAHIEFLQDKRLASMEKKLVTAEKKLQQGDYGWISRELFFNGDLF